MEIRRFHRGSAEGPLSPPVLTQPNETLLNFACIEFQPGLLPIPRTQRFAGGKLMKFRTLAIAAAPFAMIAASPASAAGFVNGSFETSTCGAPAGGFATVSAGNDCITGWTVESGSVDYINGYWQAQSGIRSIDLAGSNPGTISQIFDTIAGQLYSVNYYLSGNPDGGSLAKFGVVSAVNGSLISSATFLGIQGASHDNMNYLPWNFTFTATGPTTKLSFASDPSAGNFYGAALDSVTVTSAVPEPGTWALLLVGFMALGSTMRSKRGKRNRSAAFA